MKILFGHLDMTHSRLKSDLEKITDPSYDGELGECGFDEEGILIIHYPPIPLPFPLEQGQLIFRGWKNYAYSSQFSLLAMREDTFTNLSEIMAKKLEGRWSEVSKDLCGYVLSEDRKEPLISINKTDEFERTIWIGSGGAIERKLEDEDKFYNDLMELEKVTNVVVEACLSKAFRKRYIKSIPTHPIYVNF